MFTPPAASEPDADGASQTDFAFTPGFWLLLAVQTAFGLGVSAYLLLPKFLTTELHASARDIGWVTALSSVAGVLTFPVVGMWSDRTGRRPFIIGGSLVLAVTSLGFHSVDRIGPWLYLLGVTRSVAFACVFNSTTTLVTERVPARRMAEALGIFGVALLSTHAIAPAAAELIAERYGWGPVFSLASALGLLAAALTLGVDEKPRQSTRTAGSIGIGELLSRARTRRVIVTIATAGAGFGTLFVLHQPFALSLGIRRVGSFFVAYATAAVFIRVFFGQTADRFGRQRVSAIALMVFACSIAAMAGLQPGGLVPIGIVFGLAHGVLYPAFNALAVEGIAESERGKMMALYHGGFNAGQTLMVPLFGMMADAVGFRSMFLTMGLLALAVGTWLLHTTFDHAEHHASPQ